MPCSPAFSIARSSSGIRLSEPSSEKDSIRVQPQVEQVIGEHHCADERHDLSRHWRNARTHASHDPADWKYHHIGNYLLNNVHPPNHGQV